MTACPLLFIFEAEGMPYPCWYGSKSIIYNYAGEMSSLLPPVALSLYLKPKACHTLVENRLRDLIFVTNLQEMSLSRVPCDVSELLM